MNGKKGEKRKQELLRIAYRLFLERGYDLTSVDDIIAEAGIAKGTYYYYFPSKEATLEEVVNMMMSEEAERARAMISAPIPVPQKVVAVITSLRPAQNEAEIANTLQRPENLIMHDKVNRRLMTETVPLLSEVVREGVAQGIFDCDNIEERVRVVLSLSQQIFSEGRFTVRDIDVFIDIVEKTLGAKKDTLGFIRGLIT